MMNDYRELCETLRLANSWQFAPKFVNAMLDAADAIEQLVRERDAAVADLKVNANCTNCKYLNGEGCCVANWCYNGEAWEWRGVQE